MHPMLSAAAWAWRGHSRHRRKNQSGLRAAALLLAPPEQAPARLIDLCRRQLAALRR